MYDSAVSGKDRYMSGVYDNITGLMVFPAHCYTSGGLSVTGTWQAVSEVRENLLCKSGTVNTVCQAVSSIYIRITYKLHCIGDYCCSSSAVIRNTAAGILCRLFFCNCTLASASCIAYSTSGISGGSCGSSAACSTCTSRIAAA